MSRVEEGRDTHGASFIRSLMPLREHHNHGPRSSQNLRLLTPALWEFWGGGVQHSVHSRLCSDWWVQ